MNRGDLERIENAILRGLRKARMNRLGSGETGAQPEAGEGILPSPEPAELTDSPQSLRGYYSDRQIKARRDAAKVCICPSHASNRGECPVHDHKGRPRSWGQGDAGNAGPVEASAIRQRPASPCGLHKTQSRGDAS